MAQEALRATDNIKPTLTDEEVLEFCKTGILTLEGVIPDAQKPAAHCCVSGFAIRQSLLPPWQRIGHSAVAVLRVPSRIMPSGNVGQAWLSL